MPSDLNQMILTGVTTLVPLILSLTVHEFAHAWSALKLGDDTAAREGRYTLNPLPHIDLFGTILLPLLGVPFGWAKPVPVNPVRFSRRVTMRTGMLLTAAAGPLSNALLAVLCTVIFGMLYRFAPGSLAGPRGVSAVGELIRLTIGINVALALFNLIPVPPLDGSRIVDGVMPERFRPRWESFTRLGPLLLIGVIFFSRGLIEAPMQVVLGILDSLFQLIGSG